MGKTAFIGYETEDGTFVGGIQMFDGDSIAPILNQCLTNPQDIDTALRFGIWDNIIEKDNRSLAEMFAGQNGVVCRDIGCAYICTRDYSVSDVLNAPGFLRRTHGAFLFDSLDSVKKLSSNKMLNIQNIYIFDFGANKWSHHTCDKAGNWD
ncbi:MAG: hypothetical protein VZR00_08660 [Lachnospiraceae bacterium]|nr:hypothetical protein [Oribacterium sp.]MEE3461938.1 hypothetical protein [Lachnospiraceae bacterium]